MPAPSPARRGDAPPAGCPAFPAATKAPIAAARTHAALAVNSELIRLYWEIGHEIGSLDHPSVRSAGADDSSYGLWRFGRRRAASGVGILRLVSHRDVHHPGLIKAASQPRAVRAGAAATLPEEQRAAAIERLLARSTRRKGLDWDLYSRVDREAWGHGAGAE